jgi:hypothetical protein
MRRPLSSAGENYRLRECETVEKRLDFFVVASLARSRGMGFLGVRFLPKISVGRSVCARSGKKNRVAGCVALAGQSYP